MNENFDRRFRGPTPPPAVDRAVLAAAQSKAADLAGSGLPKKAEMSYSGKSGQDAGRETAMSDAIVFPCPACGTKYSVGPSHAGKKTTCKKCGAPVTVPSPQVANPTIVGGTRTIRRADIDPGASAREEATGVPAPSVDMSGGASVLRKEETVIAAPPVASPGTSARGRGQTHVPAPGTHRPTATGRTPGRPPMPGAPAKKNNMPLFAGIGGGVLAVVLVVVIIVASSGGGGGGGGGADGTAKGGPNAPAEDPDKSLLVHHQKSLNNVMSLQLEQVRAFYDEAKARNAKPEWKKQQDDWAKELSIKADSADAVQMAQIALLLDNDGYAHAKNLLRTAASAMQRSGKAVRKENRDGRTVNVADKTFEDVARRIGWESYNRPAEIDDYLRLEIDGAREYSQFYLSLDQVYADTKLFPPEVVSELRKLEKVAVENGKAFMAVHDKDKFAKNAREEWLRFKLRNDSKAKWNRAKRQRSFSPAAMRREGESFDQIWTYTYWKPFIVYVEKPPGAEGLSEEFKESLDSKSALLEHLYAWFTENFITRFGLKRVKPIGDGERAEKEGWPLSVVVLKDSHTFEQYCEDETGQPIPGARAFYSPSNEIVITYDDRLNSDPDRLWFNESVLIHESFHMLSDFYAANPIDHSKYDRKRGEAPPRPSYSSILVQEGITDSVAGFVREGQGRNSKYKFLEQNHLRLKSWQSNYASLNNRNVFRIQELLKSGSYVALVYVGCDRLREFGINVPHGGEGRFQGPLMGLYYATACQMSYFFHHYKEGGKYLYRDKWWEFLGMDYKGEIVLTSFDTTPGTEAFKKVFGIKSEADWEAINKKFEAYTKDLKPEDVGKGFEDGEVGKSNSIEPDFTPPWAQPGQGTKQHGMRREEEAVGAK